MQTAIDSDGRVQDDVLAELRADPRVRAAGIGVQVRDGIVTLTGSIGNWAEKLAARDAAHRVAGVLDVTDEIELHLASDAQRTDDELAAAVRHALQWDTFVPDTRVRTTVSAGWVTLDGDVDHAFQAEAVVRAVSRLQGVRGVKNSLLVKPNVTDPTHIRAAIEDALLRQTRREAKRISIRVADGVVRLSGMVRSWTEKRAIEAVALHVPGVRKVENRLDVDPSG